MTSNGKQPHIVCINHTPEILQLMKDLLEGEGYRVSTLMTMERDLDAVVALSPNLIVLDYMWTTSDNEWTLLTMMSMDPRTRGIPIILCTGAVSQATEMEGHLASIGVKVVFKPFDIDVLLQTVRECLEKKIPADRTSHPDA